MSRVQWAQRVVGRTRGEILGLLCQGPRTVSDASKALGLTANGVRTHLAALEADGLVELTGSKRRIGKPAHVFELTPAGRSLLSTAYRPVLHGLLDALSKQDSSAVEEVIRFAGQRVAANYPKATGDLRTRAEQGAAVLRELGGLSNVDEEGKALVIRGVCCPLGALVADHPEVCSLVAALLGEVLDQPVREFCRKTEPLKCQFEVRPAEANAGRKRSSTRQR
jgi:predicted ArsR family transcriptional regulator